VGRIDAYKSSDDEYLMFVLASAFQGNEHKKNHFESKVMRAFQRRPHILPSFLKNLTPVYLEDENGEIEESAVFQVNLKRFDSSVFHIACGIYYYHFKSKWLGNFKVFTNILMDLKSKNALDVNDLMTKICEETSALCSGEVAIGENQEIFRYKLISDVSNRYLVHMVFYDEVEISVLLANV